MDQSKYCKQEPIFLFFGYASEYTLNSLYVYMRDQGDNCIEIDMFTCADVVREIKSLIGRKIVFVTSAHMLLDETNFSYHYEHACRIISPLHIISTLKPSASIYYPHDLTEPIKPEEIPYLHIFDLFLSPLEHLNALNKYLPVTNVGWIKHLRQSKSAMPPDFNPSKAVLFAAHQANVNLGLEYFYEKHKPLFEAGVAIKLPHWHGSTDFENFLRERNVLVYLSEANSIQVMKENDLIFTQAISSTVVEASRLGKKVVYVKDKELDHRNPETEFALEKNLVYVNSPADAAAIMPESIPNGEFSLEYFDFEKARNAIWSTYRSKVANV